MTQYAYFDGQSGRVMGWIDTEAMNHGPLPPAERLIEVTKAQWATRETSPWHVADGKLTKKLAPPKPEPSPAEVLSEQKGLISQALRDAARHARNVASGDADEMEISLWPVKAQAARAVMAGQATQGQLHALQVEAQARGAQADTADSLLSLCKRIADKSDRFLKISAAVDGHRKAGLMAIEAATTQQQAQDACDKAIININSVLQDA